MGILNTLSILEEAVQNRVQIIGLTVDQYDWLLNEGKLPEDTTTELIDGFIVKKDRSALGEDPMTVGDRHRMAVVRLAQLAHKFSAHGCFLQTQQPVALPPRNEPEPDISVIRGTVEDINRKPRPADVIFVLEVSDSSFKRDTTIKLGIYAQAKIPVYILIDLQHEVVLVHRKPSGKKYADVTELRSKDMLKLPTADKSFVTIEIAKLL